MKTAKKDMRINNKLSTRLLNPLGWIFTIVGILNLAWRFFFLGLGVLFASAFGSEVPGIVVGIWLIVPPVLGAIFIQGLRFITKREKWKTALIFSICNLCVFVGIVISETIYDIWSGLNVWTAAVILDYVWCILGTFYVFLIAVSKDEFN